MTTVFFDIDTQLDFVYPSGKLYAAGAERILNAVAALNRHAATNGIPLISTMDAHSENDPEFAAWPPHCVVGTLGQRKPCATLLDRAATIPNVAGTLAIPDAPQILLEKQSVDCFHCIHLPALLEHFHAERFVVYGVVTEICVANAVRGLLKTGKQVHLVTDAVRALADETGREALSELERAGAVLTGASAIL